MLRVDLERRTVAASVRALVAGPPRPGGGVARARREWGLEVHRRYGEERARLTPGFRAEVAVGLRHAVDGFEVSLTGRADGVIDRGGALVVEEVKSARHATPEHRLQLRLYALCLHHTHPGRVVRARLVLAERDLEIAFDPARTVRTLEERVRAAIAGARRREERARARRALAAELRFPYPTLRRGQRALMDAVAEGLAEGRPVLAEAPTGIGKTVCALLPALRFALEHDARLFFLTAKTTQQRLVARTFRDLAPPGLRALTQRAKARMCPPQTLLCHPDHCAYLDRPADPAFVPRTPHLAPDVIFSHGEQARVCPHALSLALAAEMDLVIGDYNYVYAPAAAPALERTVVIVDEAHNLSDRVRAHHSPVLTRAQVADPLTRWRFPSWFDRLDACIADRELRPEVWAELRRDAVEHTVRYAYEGGLVRPDDPLLDVLATVVALHDALSRDTPEFVPYADGARVGVWCVNAAPVLRPIHERLRGCVAMSATLRPTAHYSEVLGVTDPVTVSLPSPFPPENRCVVIVPSVQTTLRERPRHYARIARTVENVVAVRPGRYIAYFPSFSFLDAVRAHLDGSGVVAQRPGPDRRVVLDRLDGDADVLLLAVLGGVFAEGIDIRGLHGAIVVGPGLPAVSEERTAMRTYFDQLTGHGFQHAMLYPGMQRVVQAAGRVHRAPTDKGVIVLLDRRFTQHPYGE
ncbi:MAG: DEAD/DEAH box helicase, partial [Planctomycetota bacterium]|nr:DEAD/DEAH box helicase [Planctomycetota bacterium]